MSIFVDVLKLVVIAVWMLDADYWIPDIEDYFNSEIEKHPASRGQHPVAANTGKGLRRSD